MISVCLLACLRQEPVGGAGSPTRLAAAAVNRRAACCRKTEKMRETTTAMMPEVRASCSAKGACVVEERHKTGARAVSCELRALVLWWRCRRLSLFIYPPPSRERDSRLQAPSRDVSLFTFLPPKLCNAAADMFHFD
jgi:hypothetical protein